MPPIATAAGQPAPARSLRQSMILGSLWMVAMRWAMRLISIVSTIVLARLLEPEHFGLIASCMVVIGLVEILTSFGVDWALIQRQDCVRAHYDTAWTIRILQTSLVTVLICSVSPWIAAHYNDPRVGALIAVISFSTVIVGLENIGVVAFRKDLEFDKEFKLKVAAKLGAFMVTMVLAYSLRSAWALAIGMLAQALISTTLSYWMHPFRPKLDLSKFSDIWGFSQWLLLRNVGMYLRLNLDRLILPRAVPSVAQFGIYSIGKEIAEMPTGELVWPMTRALFPGYAKIAHDRPRLGQAYLKALNTCALIGMPAAVGLALVAEPAVLLLLGEKWQPAAPIMASLALFSCFFMLATTVHNVLMALNYMKLLAGLVWGQFLIIGPLMVWAYQQGTVQAFADAQLYSAMLLMPVHWLSLTMMGVVSWRGVIAALWRPSLACLVMSGVVLAMGDAWMYPLLELLAKAAVGIVVFGGVQALCWWLQGRPDGGERLIIELLASKVPALQRLLVA